jgi:ribosomal protein S21
MALEIKKREKETTLTLIRRFTKSIQQSGLLKLARKIRFRERPKSRQLKKREALRREMKRKEYEKLKKLGKI